MKIIDLAAAREARESGKGPPIGKWLFNLAVYAPAVADGQYSGNIFDAADLQMAEAPHIRLAAAALENIAAILLDVAHLTEPDSDGRVLCRTTVFESSKVQTWVSDQIETAEQQAWLSGRLDDAKLTIRPLETETTKAPSEDEALTD